MLADANLGKRYWGEAIHTACYLQNRLPTRSTGKTPYELWFNKKPDRKHLHIFGCAAYRHIEDQLRKKLDDKAEKLIFVGYSDESKAYRLLDIKTNEIKISRDVHFGEILKRTMLHSMKSYFRNAGIVIKESKIFQITKAVQVSPQTVITTARKLRILFRSVKQAAAVKVNTYRPLVYLMQAQRRSGTPVGQIWACRRPGM